MKPLIGLIGYARTGKDTLADILVQELGALRVSQGDYIKQSFAGLLAGTESVWEYVERMGPHMDVDQFWRMYFHHGAPVIDFARSYRGVDAFTQYDPVKDRIRPLLEHGGYVILPWVEAQMWRDIHAYPGPVVNSRLFDRPQCEAWREHGGAIWEVHKAGVKPKTQYERENIALIRELGLINMDLHNNHSLQDWQDFGRGLARHVRGQLEVFAPEALSRPA